MTYEESQRLRLRPDKGCGRQTHGRRHGGCGGSAGGRHCPGGPMPPGCTQCGQVCGTGRRLPAGRARRARPAAPRPLAAALTSRLSLPASSFVQTHHPQLEDPGFPVPRVSVVTAFQKQVIDVGGEGRLGGGGEGQEGRQAEWKGDSMVLPGPTEPARCAEGLLLQPHHPDTICPHHDFPPLLLPLPWSELT